ncbi:OB-fold nucleic acid binding domain-containing protein [Luteimicrobium subarcticum]|uniref:ATP-dependent DNA helicase RecG n=1 Tax=Luteimicrobium subarcticum TaxID=620910 RepID=A0A2M8W464_9MICO|nr:OB-fold nucleic acid binding domain-containing protein [Luteimicrobium subarcticum]PJI85703.1 ATP-dependent DNA helicase RecG [Luteimicrobium subarcticum]
MSLRAGLRAVFASRDDVEADEERDDAARQHGCTAIAAVPSRTRGQVSGVVRSVTMRPREGAPALGAELYDGTGTLDLVWLGRRRIAGIEPGRRVRVEGLVCTIDGRRTMYNPRYELRPVVSA